VADPGAPARPAAPATLPLGSRASVPPPLTTPPPAPAAAGAPPAPDPDEPSEVFALTDTDVEILPGVEEPLRTQVTALRDAYLAEVRRIPATDKPRQALLHLEIGRIDEESLGDLGAALDHYKEAVAADPGLAAALRAVRRHQLDKGDVVAALRSLDAEVRVCPDLGQRAALFYEKGLLQLGKSDERAAEVSFRRAVELEAAFLPALAALRRIAEARGDARSTADLLLRMAQISGDSHRKGLLMAEVGVLAEGTKQTAEALERYRVALDHDPQLVGARFALERLYTARGEWGALADLWLSRADRTSDKDVDAANRFLAGVIAAHRLGEDGRATVLQEQSWSIRPARSLPLDELTDLYQRQGRLRELVETLRRRLDLGAHDLPAAIEASLLFEIGEIHEKLGNLPEALSHYREALERSPAFLPARRALMRTLRAGDLNQEAAALLRAEADGEADPARLHDLLIRLADFTERTLDSPEEAIRIYEEALGIAPGRGPSFRALDRLFTARGEWRRLASLLVSEAERTRDHGRRGALLKRMAWLEEVHLGEPEAAVKTLERLLGDPPSERDVLAGLSRVYESLDRTADLVQNLEREAAASTDEDEVLVLLLQAGELAESRLSDTGRARQLYLKVLERDPRYLPALRNLGRLYHAAGFWDELVETYKRELAASTDPRVVAILSFRVAQLLEGKLGDDAGAERFYREALKQTPDYTPALEALASLHGRRGRWKELTEILVARGAALQTPKRRAEALLRAALLAFHRLADSAQAIQLCRQALEADPGLVEALLYREQLLGTLGRFDELADELEASLNDDRRPPTVRVRDGLKLCQVRRVHLGRPDAAIAAARAVLELEPRSAEALHVLSQLHAQLGQIDDLTEALGRLADTTTDPVTATADLVHLAAVLPGDASHDAVQSEIFDRVLAIHPTHPYALTALERLARRHGDLHSLADIMRRRAEDAADPVTATVSQLTLGDLLLREHQLDEAATWYARAARTSPAWLPPVRALRLLREAQGRSSEIAELLERECELTADPEAAVRALMQAANIWLQSYMDTERAEALYAKVFERDPTNAVAFQRLTALLTGRDAFAELLPYYRRRIAVAPPEERARLLLELADLQEAHLGRPEDAVATLEEVLQLAPGSVEPLTPLARLNRQLGRWRAAAQTLETLAQVTTSAEVRRQAHAGRAELLEKEMGEDAAALAAVEAILAEAPGDREALRSAARLQRRLGNFQGTAEALGRLADGASPGERAATLLELAEVYERGLQQPAAAQEHVARAAALCCLAPEALGPLREHFAQRGDLEGLEPLLARVIAGAPAQAQGMTALRLAHAELLAGPRLRRYDEAEREIRQVLTEAPRSVSALIALGELHLLRDNPALAQVEYHSVLEQDPFRPDAYRGLRRVFTAKGEEERARLTSQVLVALGAASTQEQQLATAVASPLTAATRALGAEAYGRLLATREDPPAARAWLAALAPYLEPLFPPEPGRWGYLEGSELSASHPLRTRADAVARLLGLERPFRVGLGRARPDDVIVVAAATPLVVIGESAARLTDPRLDFLLGRALGRLLAGTEYLDHVHPRDLELTLAGVTAQFERGYGLHLGDEDQLQTTGRAVLKPLARKQKKALEEPARAFSAADPPNVTAWTEAARAGAQRCGLLVCADPAAALAVLRANRARDDELAGLLVFNLTPRYAEARALLLKGGA
jgi:tetratricopeptide (TPR) repeat protein